MQLRSKLIPIVPDGPSTTCYVRERANLEFIALSTLNTDNSASKNACP